MTPGKLSAGLPYSSKTVILTAEESDIIIIGGGLSGLATAYFLQQNGRNTRILEARDRLGGRIETIRKADLAPQEMGATWLGKKHTALLALLRELGLDIFEQVLGTHAIYEPISTSPPQLVQLPPNEAPSYRIRGGSSTLIEALAQQLDPRSVHAGELVVSIEQERDALLVRTKDHTYRAERVISTLPPWLLLKTIKISPALPAELQEIMQQTHTWMGESIKVGLYYPTPFWRNGKTSGTIFSNVGPISEMYDHSDFADERFALKGFFNSVYFPLRRAQRLEMVLEQLRRYFGHQADDFLDYEEKVWRQDPLTFAAYHSHVLPHQHNGHSAFHRPYLDGRLVIAGSETATAYPGYMDGAVRSAQAVTKLIGK